MVYFRISDDEFEQMLQLCERTGARSVSDLARAAVREFGDRKKDEFLETKGELCRLIEELTESVHRLVGIAEGANRAEDIAADPGMRTAGEST
jgi:hypothetical protein